MPNQYLENVADTWARISHTVFVAHTEEEYKRLVAFLDILIDEVGEDEEHPLASLMELLGTLIEKYEEEYVPDLGDSVISPN